MNNDKRVAWILGASSGIGEALCFEYADKGYDIILSARREEELQRVQKLLDTHVKSGILPHDLKNTEGVLEIVKEASEFFGRIDVVVLSGGLSQRSNAFETPMSVDREIMEVNYFGQIAIVKALLPVFRKQAMGHFVVISSLTGKFGFFLRSAYAASKHALHGFFESLRLEEQKNGVRVTIICPTLIKTNISVNALDKSGSKTGEMDDMQTNGMDPRECARQIFSAQQRNKLEAVIGKKKQRSSDKKTFPKFISSTYIEEKSKVKRKH